MPSSRIHEKSWVSISFAIAVIGGGAAWMTRQELTTSANAAQIQEVVHQYGDIEKKLSEMDKRLIVIETLLRRLSRRNGIQD